MAAQGTGGRKIAVVGTGAAGLGALEALLAGSTENRITVFDIGEPVPEAPGMGDLSPTEAPDFYAEIYRQIRAHQPFKFPPPKTHFAQSLPRHPLGGKPGLFKSHSVGGLTNYWGGTMLPYTDQELEHWPVDRRTLDPFYQRIAERTGIAGCDDDLNRYFRADFSTRPPLRLTPMMTRLSRTINAGPAEGAFDLASGINRCTLETREDHPGTCCYCGECLAGCFRDAVYSTRQTMAGFFADPRVTYQQGKVLSVDPETRAIRCEGQAEPFTGFDKVFLCAGCPGTTEIVLRSHSLSRVSEMQDNAVYVFPILYLGPRTERPKDDPYLSLSNLIVGCLPRTPDLRFAQVQIYPNFDYLWRYNIPPVLWSVFRLFSPRLRARIFWGRLYVDGSLSQAYQATLENDRIRFEPGRRADTTALPALMESIRSAINRSGFKIPVRKPILQKTNSHYAATLPYGGPHLEVSPTGEIAPGVHLCDSACFPELPAVSLTFTIMANACRTVTEALRD